MSENEFTVLSLTTTLHSGSNETVDTKEMVHTTTSTSEAKSSITTSKKEVMKYQS